MPRGPVAFLGCLLAACGGDAVSEPPDAAAPDAAVHTGLAELEARHYDFAVDLRTLRATSTVRLRVTGPGDCLELGFRPAAAEEVSLDGEPARDVQVAGGALHACDPVGHGWSAGETVTLGVTADVPSTTWGVSQVGYSTSIDLEGNPFSYLLSWIGGCDRHGPCDARPDRFATYRFTVDHEAGVQVLCPGTITPGQTRTVCDFNFAGGPTYSTFALMAGKSWTPTPLGSWGGVRVTLLDYPATNIARLLDTDAIAAHFAWMQTTFGPYPYGEELRLVSAPTYWLGFEHPGNIALSETLAQRGSHYANQLTHTTMHEITHQWAGDQTTLADTYDFVWKEAMAEYLTYVSEGERISAAVAEQTARAWKTFAESSLYHIVPDERPPLLDYYDDLYGPGPMILFRQLEAYFGRDAILQALVALIGGGSPRTVSIDDVREALEAATGADLGVYFDAWVYGEGAPAWPRAAASWSEEAGGTHTLSVSVTTADGVPRGCRFAVRLAGAAGESFDVPIDTGLDGAAAEQTMTVTPGFVPVSYAVDPASTCLVWKPTPAAAPARRISPWVVTR